MSDHPVVDFHSYLGSEPYGDHAQCADDLIAAMDRCGIDVAVVAPFVDSPGPDLHAHRTLEEASRQFPQRLIPFARLDPRYGAEALAILEMAIDGMGFRGLLFSPVSTNSLPYHRGVLPLMRAAAERSIPVLIPAGNCYVGLPEQIAWLAAALPDLTVVLGHMGTAAHAVRAIALAAEHPNLYLETSLQQSPRRLSLAVDSVGADRILFGSAAPYGQPGVELLKVRKAGLDHGSHVKILGLNAARLLGLAAGTDRT
ncbi:MAG: amidohydrolase [Anaerolineae bacterium]|nr:amidohydrolase [Anaerolineae bacterium]